jgi:hypothetical protein
MSEAVTPRAKADLTYDDFFLKDELEISVQSVYSRAQNPDRAEQQALITQLKLIAKAKGYNVWESDSMFTGARYIHFKKHRLEAPKPKHPTLPSPDECIEAEEVRKAIR